MLALLVALTAGCASRVEFHPADSDEFVGKDLLILESSLLPPLPEEMLIEIQERFARELKASPYLRRVFTPGEFRESIQGDPRALQDYSLLSDTMSVIGILDREITSRIQKRHAVDLVGMVQMIQLPCRFCERESRLALMSILGDTLSGKITWRIHFTENIDFEPERSMLEEAAEELTEDLFVLLENLLEPKWHRLRFDHLRKSAI